MTIFRIINKWEIFVRHVTYFRESWFLRKYNVWIIIVKIREKFLPLGNRQKRRNFAFLRRRKNIFVSALVWTAPEGPNAPTPFLKMMLQLTILVNSNLILIIRNNVHCKCKNSTCRECTAFREITESRWSTPTSATRYNHKPIAFCSYTCRHGLNIYKDTKPYMSAFLKNLLVTALGGRC